MPTMPERVQPVRQLCRSIACVEHGLAGPANRIGGAVSSGAELKVTQEAVTPCVFIVCAILRLGEKIAIGHLVGFALIGLGAFFVFKGSSRS
ncbi:DMT family protein [Methylocella sp.]|uniref:DMT family protein n=1 Tax=Methylocella sp. TaxID=1978226 RepID=UPI0037836008